jgi:predicted amidohydrolase YtcJ
LAARKTGRWSERNLFIAGNTLNSELTRTTTLVLLTSILAACSGGAESPEATNPKAIQDDTIVSSVADEVFTNGKVYTVNEDQPWAEAVAVSGNDIVYVGDDAGANPFVGPDTEVMDLEGKVLLPGFIGSHDHPIPTIIVSAGGQLTFSKDADTMLAETKTYVESHPDGPYFTFGGATENTVPITKEKIDAIISDKPFIMIASTGHGSWLNSAALEKMGIRKGTPDPIDSFERDENGEPTGNAPSSAATFYAMVQLGLVSKEAVMKHAPAIFDHIASRGVTAVMDPGTPPGTEAVVWGAFAELEKQGRLKVRVQVAAMAQREVHIAGALAALKKYGPMYSSELFNVNVLKLHGGSPDGYTSAFLEPYSDRPGFYGETPFSPEAQKAAALAAAEMGYDIHTHAIGDKNIRQALDTYQAVREAGYDDIRMTTGHTGVVQPEDLLRYAELDIIANTYGLRNAEPVEVFQARIGPERSNLLQPMGSFLKLGVHLSASADWATAPLDPFRQITVFMTRSRPGVEESLGPESERLTLEQSIHAWTMGSAYQLRMEDKIGSLEVGKRADLIIIDRDIFELTPDQIWDTNVLLTMMNGNITYQDGT